MKLISTLFLMLTFSLSSAFAHDSSWGLCKTKNIELFGEKNALAINVFEHRNAKGDGRATDLTMLFGNWSLVGSADTTSNDTAKVALKGKNSNFTGTVSFIYDDSSFEVEIKGTLKLGKLTTPVNSIILCEDLTN